MKWIRKIAVGLLSLILIDSIFAIIISFNLKYIIINSLIKTTVFSVDTFNPNYAETALIDEKYLNELKNNEKAQEIINSKEMDELLEKYLDITMDSLEEEEHLKEIQLEADILIFLKNHKEQLGEVVGVDVTDEMIEEVTTQLEGKDLTKRYVESIKNTKNSMSETELGYLKVYKFMNSNLLKQISILIGIISLSLILLIQKPRYLFIKNISHSLWVSGIGSIIMSLSIKTIIQSIRGIELISTTRITIIGIILIIYGILLYLIYKVIEKKKKEEMINDVSKKSKE